MDKAPEVKQADISIDELEAQITVIQARCFQIRNTMDELTSELARMQKLYEQGLQELSPLIKNLNARKDKNKN
jgi:uncharacterized coiled-coil protein SlyX